jgi:hypothetical protein
MKRVLLSICALALIVTSVGCACNCNKCRPQRGGLHGNACGPQGCGPGGCGPGGCGLLGQNGGGGHGHGKQVMPSGAAGVAYPYYTTRGPRDFLSANPRGIGP